MGAKGQTSIKLDILTFIRSHGGAPKDYYVGISEDAVQRLTAGHGVDPQQHPATYQQTRSSDDARALEDVFVNEVRTDGSTGGGDDTTDQIYVYKKGPGTKP